MSDHPNSTPESSTDAEMETTTAKLMQDSHEAHCMFMEQCDWTYPEGTAAKVALFAWRDRCVAEAVETAKLEGAIEQLQKSKRYYGPPMHGGIDNRINRLKRKLAALLPITGEVKP